MKLGLPKEVADIAKTLTEAGFLAYLVGGSLRDVLLDKEPTDWDLATNATPEEIQKLFTDSVYKNTFGTVGIKTRSDNSRLAVVEVTTFRLEGGYSDKRHPDSVRFAKTIEEDLARRDFTVNAMALSLGGKTQTFVDPWGGQKDLQAKIIRTVGDAEERFGEDALRLLRAVRFMAQLGFALEQKTCEALAKLAPTIKAIAAERIRDELNKLLMTPRATEGVMLLEESGLLAVILPELQEGVGVGQNKHHIYTVFEHNLRSLEYAVKKNFALHLRIASLLHDVGKPRTKRGEGLNSTFYGHQVIGERMARKILERLKFPKNITDDVALLVREHMFVYDPEVVTLAGVRRLIRRVGTENVDDLLKLREADRIGSGVPKAQPYRLRYLKAMIEKVQNDPVSVKMLSIRGDDVMRIANIPPSPKVGMILAVLLEEILEDPRFNDKAELEKRIKELAEMTEESLREKSGAAKKKAEAVQARIDEEIKKKYSV